jgi:hypothetical protein
MALWGDADNFCDRKYDRSSGNASKGSGKASAADRAISYVLEAGVELFHDQHGEAFIAFDNLQGRTEVWPIKSKAASNLLRCSFYSREGRGLSGDALSTARGTLAAQAQFQGMERRLALRVAHVDGAIWYDLGDWRAVRITAKGWEVIERPPILFRHFSHQSPQAEPLGGGNLDQVLHLFNVQGSTDRLLLKVYLVAGLLSGIPLPVLLIYGEQGSAKTSLLKILRALLDPSSLATVAPPDNLREFVQQAAHHRTLYLDNLSYFPGWMSDALCRLCTGEGFSKRELYTDDEDIVYNFRGLGGITGINLVVTKPDLLDRAIILRLDPIPDHQRRTEEELWDRFNSLRPQLLGAMFDVLADALQCYPRVNISRLPRLADFARWGVAIAQALGHQDVEFLEAYGVNVTTQNEAALEESVVAQALLEPLGRVQQWVGSSTQLLEELVSQSEQLHLNVRAKAWPKSPSALSRRIREILPNLRLAGIHVLEERPSGVTKWTLSRGQGGNAPIAAIAPTSAAKSPGRTAQMPPLKEAMPPPDAPSISYESGDSGGNGGISPHSTEPIERENSTGFSPGKAEERDSVSEDPWESFLKEAEEGRVG